MVLVDIVLGFITQLLSQPSILIGLYALIGLMIQRKALTEIITGTIKTIMGFALIGAGAGVLIGSIDALNGLMTAAFNLTGTLPVNEAAYAAASAEFGTALAGVMAVAMVANIVLARFSRFKFIYLTGHEIMWVSTVCAIVMSALGMSTPMTIITGGMITGLYMAVFPALIYKSVCKVTGETELAVGHSGIIFYWFAAGIAKLVGNPKKSAEEVNVPKSLNFLKDLSVSLSLAMFVVYMAVLIAASQMVPDVYAETLGSTNMIIFAVLRSIEFAAAIYIIQAGVRMVVASLIPAFQGVAEKIIPNAIPSLDIPILYPYMPNATLIGFLCAAVGAVVTFFIQVALVGTALELPIILPTLFTAFFYGATYGCLCNAEGGLRGTIIGSFVASIFSSITPALLIKFGGVLVDGTTFGGGDSAVVGIFLNQVGQLLSGNGVFFVVLVLFLLPIVFNLFGHKKTEKVV